jgi:Uma2 family endonuclease
MAYPALKRMTVDEFLSWDDGTDRRYELVAGEIIAMAPPSERHGTIVMNIGREIGNQLRPPCRAVGEAGVRLSDRDDTYYQADVAVTCAPPSAANHVPAPTLIVEVLSPSTETHDRGRKVPDYCAIESVREILLISSSAREVQLWRRTGTSWIVTSRTEGRIELESVGATLGFDAIYAGTDL